MEVVQPRDQRVERAAEVCRCVGFGPGELVVPDDQGREVGAVEPLGQLDQDGVALIPDALKDPADGLGNGGVALEPRRLEPLPPLAQVEEPEHSGPLEALVMVRALGRGRGGVADPDERPVANEQDPAAHADRERGRDQHAECQQERGLSIHEPHRVHEAPAALTCDVVGQRLFRWGRSVPTSPSGRIVRHPTEGVYPGCPHPSRSGAGTKKRGSRSSSSWWWCSSSAS